MTLPYKIQIAKTVTNVLNRNLDISVDDIASRIRVHPFQKTEHAFIVSQELSEITHGALSALKKELNFNVQVQYISEKPHLAIYVNQEQFAYDILTYKTKDMFYYRKPSKVLIEFSSPNIAKRFHWGHLRSTVIGNFICNISEFARNNVTRINYLGDWGLQLGMLKVGLETRNYSVKDFEKNPLKILQEAYLLANAKSKETSAIEERAKKIFHDLEFANENDAGIEEWLLFRQHTIKELSRVYSRLNIRFDHYSWESDYSAKKIQPLIKKLENDKIIVENEGALMTWIDGKPVPFLKSDGSTLYLSRDVAAAVDRYQRFNFDKMFYVVDSSQRGHFVALIRVLEKFHIDCASKIEYLPFGRVAGMSTRKGEGIGLEEILDEAYKIMEQKQIQTFTRKANIGGTVAEVLGKSALIVSDLKRKRMTNYAFDWNRAMKPDGYSGVKLQYCHCRLHSLAENCNASLPTQCDPKLLHEPEALALIHCIARFEDNLIDALEKFEAFVLVHYLFELSDNINKAFKVLRVKGEDSCTASQRLLLFMKAKEVLNTGMKILGLEPLDQM